MAKDIDLLTGVVPISKAACSLAALLRQGARDRRPIVVTQKGRPTGVILSVERYVQLAEAEERAQGHRAAAPFDAGAGDA